MTPESQALLDLTQPKTGTTSTLATDNAYTAAQTMHALLKQVQTQVLSVRDAVRSANATETDEGVYVQFETFDQLAKAAQRHALAATESIDRLCDTLWQLDQQAITSAQRIADLPRVEAETAANKLGRVTVSKVEFDALTARATQGDDAVSELNRLKSLPAPAAAAASALAIASP